MFPILIIFAKTNIFFKYSKLLEKQSPQPLYISWKKAKAESFQVSEFTGWSVYYGLQSRLSNFLQERPRSVLYVFIRSFFN